MNDERAEIAEVIFKQIKPYTKMYFDFTAYVYGRDEQGRVWLRMKQRPDRMTWVYVTLDADDTYLVERVKVRRKKGDYVREVVGRRDGVYFDVLNTAIFAVCGYDRAEEHIPYSICLQQVTS